MALRYAVMGLLSGEEMSGYDLTQQFSMKVSHFWNAHHTQIYRELQKLEVEGLVSHRLIEQQDRPDKKLYKLTEPGMKELFTWLSEEPKPPKMKNESLLRVSLFHLIPPAQAIAFLEASRDTHAHILSMMDAFRGDYMSESQEPIAEKVGEYLTLDFGMRFMRSWMEWCDFAIGVFKRLEENQTS
ncbi:PadR family transcriptional regulator [Tumebacillus avium]|nr:PadR family transcriptional regulator [Tumebacillus avium]